MIVLDASLLPNWVQAGAAVALVVLTAATLWVLKRYADDTGTIAKASAAQTENSQMPILVLIRHTIIMPNYKKDEWSIQNQGFGPALNIRFTGCDDGANETSI